MESKIVPLVHAECRMVLASGWGGSDGEMLLHGYKISVMQDEGIPGIFYTPQSAASKTVLCT